MTPNKDARVNDAGTERHLYGNKMNYPYLTPNTKMNSKWIIDLTVHAKTIKLLDENTKENLCHLRTGKDFRQNIKSMTI